MHVHQHTNMLRRGCAAHHCKHTVLLLTLRTCTDPVLPAICTFGNPSRASGAVPAEKLITHRAPLEKWEETFNAIENLQALKGLMIPG